FVNGKKAAAGKNQLITDLRIAAEHEAQQFDLLLGVRRKVGVAAFGRHHAVARAVPGQNGLAQAGAGSAERAGTPRPRIAGIEYGEIGRGKILNAVAPRPEVVEQDHVRNVELLREHGSVDGPRKVGGAHAVVNHRAGDAEPGSADFFVAEVRRGDTRELLGNEIELGKILTAEALLENRSQFS